METKKDLIVPAAVALIGLVFVVGLIDGLSGGNKKPSMPAGAPAAGPAAGKPKRQLTDKQAAAFAAGRKKRADNIAAKKAAAANG